MAAEDSEDGEDDDEFDALVMGLGDDETMDEHEAAGAVQACSSMRAAGTAVQALYRFFSAVSQTGGSMGQNARYIVILTWTLLPPPLTNEA